MKCKKCGSERISVVSETKGKIKKRGCLGMLFHLTLIFCTCGMWIIVPMLRGGTSGKIKSRTKCVCMDCGYEWFN